MSKVVYGNETIRIKDTGPISIEQGSLLFAFNPYGDVVYACPVVITTTMATTTTSRSSTTASTTTTTTTTATTTATATATSTNRTTSKGQANYMQRTT